MRKLYRRAGDARAAPSPVAAAGADGGHGHRGDPEGHEPEGAKPIVAVSRRAACRCAWRCNCRRKWAGGAQGTR